MSEPNVLIIGAQKAATTAILRNLANVPSVWSVPKELQYFGSRYNRGIDYYRKSTESLLPSGDPPSVIIEKSPSYMTVPEAPWRIRSWNKSVKIIACLREPISRAFSRYRDIQVDEPDRYGSKPFSSVVRRHLKRDSHLITTGHYATQLAPYFALFDKEQICIVIQERLKRNAQEEMDRISEFLGVEKLGIPPATIHSNPRAAEDTVDEETQALLEAHYKPHNERLFMLLNDEIEEWRYQS